MNLFYGWILLFSCFSFWVFAKVLNFFEFRIWGSWNNDKDSFFSCGYWGFHFSWRNCDVVGVMCGSFFCFLMNQVWFFKGFFGLFVYVSHSIQLCTCALFCLLVVFLFGSFVLYCVIELGVFCVLLLQLIVIVLSRSCCWR